MGSPGSNSGKALTFEKEMRLQKQVDRLAGYGFSHLGKSDSKSALMGSGNAVMMGGGQRSTSGNTRINPGVPQNMQLAS